MDMFDLEAFIKVINTNNNFSGAANALNITQSTLSQRIRRLESELGYSLFLRQRGSHRTELTQEGIEFYKISIEIQELWNKAKEISGAQMLPMLHLSIVESVLRCTLPKMLVKFIHENPHIHILVSSYFSSESYQKINDNTLDMAIVGSLNRFTNISTTPLYFESWSVVCDKQAPYAPVIDPKDLNPKSRIRTWDFLNSEWDHYWFPQQPDYNVNVTTMSALEDGSTFTGDSWSVLPASVARYYALTDKVKICKLTSPPPPRIIYLIHRTSDKREELMNLKMFIKEYLRTVPDITIMY